MLTCVQRAESDLDVRGRIGEVDDQLDLRIVEQLDGGAGAGTPYLAAWAAARSTSRSATMVTRTSGKLVRFSRYVSLMTPAPISPMFIASS